MHLNQSKYRDLHFDTKYRELESHPLKAVDKMEISHMIHSTLHGAKQLRTFPKVWKDVQVMLPPTRWGAMAEASLGVAGL